MIFEEGMFYEDGSGIEAEFVCRTDKYTKDSAIEATIDDSTEIQEMNLEEKEIKKIYKFDLNVFVKKNI